MPRAALSKGSIRFVPHTSLGPLSFGMTPAQARQQFPGCMVHTTCYEDVTTSNDFVSGANFWMEYDTNGHLAWIQAWPGESGTITMGENDEIVLAGAQTTRQQCIAEICRQCSTDKVVSKKTTDTIPEAGVAINKENPGYFLFAALRRGYICAKPGKCVIMDALRIPTSDVGKAPTKRKTATTRRSASAAKPTSTIKKEKIAPKKRAESRRTPKKQKK